MGVPQARPCRNTRLEREPGNVCRLFPLLYSLFPAFSVPQPEVGDELPILLEICLPNVVEEPAPLAHHLEEPTPRVVILVVTSEVLGEVVDTGGEQRYLNSGRTAVVLMELVLLDYFLTINRHNFFYASSRVCAT
jgi:hypothetical protein